MSVSMYWKPTDPFSGTYFDDTSSLKAILETTFGEFPAVLDENHIQKLEGMVACGYNSLNDLIDAIRAYGSITIS